MIDGIACDGAPSGGEPARVLCLGPLEVHAAGASGGRQSLPLGPFKQRILLAMLLSSAGRVRSVNSLVDALWSDGPPRTAHKNIHVYVSHLRMLPGAERRVWSIDYRAGGYVLTLRDAVLDVLEFQELSRCGRRSLRENRPAEAVKHLEAALSLWRGAPYGDVLDVAELARESAILSEQRISTCEDLFEAKLRCGHVSEVVDSLDRLVAEHPLRERLRSIHLTALYRAGRQVEALHEYDNLRQGLAQELGLDPSPSLRQLYRSILDHDDTLLGGAPSRPDAGSVSTVPATTAHLLQLPPDICDFTGRERELTALSEAFDSSTGRRMVVVHGPVGVGKSILAVRASTRLTDRFPDGVLFVPFGSDDGIKRIAEFLEMAGLRLPEGAPEDAASYFRAWLSERRLLVILDGVSNEAAARRLIPSRGQSALLITSRHYLGGLESAFHLGLGSLTAEESTALLGRIVGPLRIVDDPAGARRVAERCMGLPLAIRVAGAWIARFPDLPLAGFAESLSPARLVHELSAGDLSLRTAYESFVGELAPEDRQALRRLATGGEERLRHPRLADDLDLDGLSARRLRTRLIEAHVLEAGDPRAEHADRIDPLLAGYLVGGESR